MDAARIGQSLKALRGSESSGSLADKLGISRSALAAYERGERIPRDEVKLRIADYFGRSVGAIFYSTAQERSVTP